MSFALVFAACVAAAFVVWHACGLIPTQGTRAVLRGAAIALLCSPGVLIGHGFAVAPAPLALVVQPSVFTLVPMALTWIAATALILLVPALRDHRTVWPTTAEDAFLSGYPVKLVVYGLVAAALLLVLFHDLPRTAWTMALRYVAFFAGAGVNFVACRWAVAARGARPYLVPIGFAVPAAAVAAPVVPLFWYAAGAVGALAGGTRARLAAGAALGVFALLVVNALWRTWLAATAPAHVTIGGGVAGNAAMAAACAVAGVVAWLALRRPREP